VSEVTTPDTWVPTGTWIRALRVPVAVTRWVMPPRSTFAERHLISSRLPRKTRNAPPAMTVTAMAKPNHVARFIGLSRKPRP